MAGMTSCRLFQVRAFQPVIGLLAGSLPDPSGTPSGAAVNSTGILDAIPAPARR